MDCPENLLNKEDCCAILRRHIKEDAVVYKSHTVMLLASLEGLIGKHYNLKILYEKDGNHEELDLFLKELNTTNKAMQYLLNSIKAYDKEEFYYTFLINEFKSNGVHVDFAPACYHARAPLLVFEDLAIRGYKNSPRRDMLDVKHCKVALKTLAKFHAATISYERLKSETDKNFVGLQHSEYLDDIVFGDQKNAATEWLECTFRGLLDLIKLLPESEISAGDYTSKLTLIMELGKQADEFAKYKSTILHGDLWSNNFMFKYRNGSPIDSILIDYQIIKYGPIALDVAQMILTNVRRRIRNVHYEELLSYYYHQFADACEENGFQAVQFISYKTFLESCEEVKILAKMQCAADHSITFLTDEVVASALQTDETFRSFLFEDRSKSMLQSFTENDLYREILTEDLLELRDLLFNT